MAAPSVVLFDLDDTLLETHEAHRAAVILCCRRAAERHPGWTPAALQEAFVRTYRTLEAQLEAGSLRMVIGDIGEIGEMGERSQ